MRAVTYIGHESGMKSLLEASENLAFYAALKGRFLCPDDAAIAAALERFDLLPLSGRRCGDLSAGQQSKLSLCRLLVEDTALWLLDEPATALDNRAKAALEACLDEHLARGGVAVVATHQPLRLRREPRALCL